VLKVQYIEHIKIFNQLNQLKLEDGTNVLKAPDRMKMVKIFIQF
jgi:hypothetical protein